MSTPRTVFISHAHADNAICEQVALALRQRGIDAWIDLKNLQDGHSLSGDITYELVRRQAFVLMLTSASNASHWVGQELDTFIAYANDNRSRVVDGVTRVIIPVLLEANLEMLVEDAVTHQHRASNWAKVFSLKAINGTNKPLAMLVQEIATAVGLVNDQIGVALSPTVQSPSPVWPEIPLPMRLARLGFNGYLINGVEVIIPPVCDVPAGRFIMGSDKQHDPQARDSEIPQYQVNLAAFQICAFPLTVAEYACAVKAGAVKEPQTCINVTWQVQQQRPDHPVVSITWYQAAAYAAWLAKVTGERWRLPIEAEWEKAARGIDGRIYPWGDEWDKTRANTDDGGPKTTTPVGSYAQQGDTSPYGVHDMAGNVYEWTSSIYQERPPYHSDQAENDANTTSARIMRGGAWSYPPVSARAASRGCDKPDCCVYIVGMRLALSAPAGA